MKELFNLHKFLGRNKKLLVTKHNTDYHKFEKSLETTDKRVISLKEIINNALC